ncbi:MAG TPA: metalloregulator ArsR/SmtB family transcription factor [Thermoanaerobaculia bacterium]|nr:metalloregulator ArsR/SmtB family transcription factor [Thermoanaerobaculia bacterium]
MDAARLARLFHALSDETRLRIVQRLLLGEQCVCNLMEPLKLGQSHLSFHMKTLKAAGLVSDRREGRWIHYSLNPGSLREVQEFLGAVGEKAERLDAERCCQGEKKKSPVGELYGFSLF